jgi:sugar (pentulose or hexulose) kinase
MLEPVQRAAGRENMPWKLQDILPKVLVAGEAAGVLTEEGAKLLDPTGELQAGIPLCPPEGDAGTGMVATNSVAERTGNVSAGTSVFAMIVLEKALSKLYPEIDMVTTPTGKPVAMVHSNNCTSDLNAWVDIFQEFAQALGWRSANPGCSKRCTARRSRAMPMAAGCWPTTTFRASTSRT